MAARIVYTGSADSEAHKIDSNGNTIWKYTEHTSNLLGIAVDPSGNVYTGSAESEAHKIDPNGNNIWKYTEHTFYVLNIAVDPGIYGSGLWVPILDQTTFRFRNDDGGLEAP